MAIHLQKESRTTKGATILEGKRARVGQVFDAALADDDSSGGWRPTVEPVEIPALPEYVQALAHGDLWPADEATARTLAGYERNQGLPEVKFDPLYGGELKTLTDWLKDLEDEKTDKTGNAKPAPATPAAAPSAPSPATSTVAAPTASPAASTKEGK